MKRPLRVTLREYGPPIEVPARVAVDFERASMRLQHIARTASPPLIVDNGTLRAIDIAGVVRVSDAIELEIAPKFLDPTAETWREDFFFAALISRYGRVLTREQLRSSRSRRSELSPLIAGALASMHETLQRVPLRTYRRRVVEDFAADGEIDPDDAVLPGENGYRQEILEFTRRNSYNSVIRHAAGSLPHVSDAGLSARLARMQMRLGEQPPLTPRALARSRVPSRFRSWQPLYDLSREVIRNSGVSLQPGAFNAPGFVVNTWRVWEDLLAAGLRIGVKGAAVKVQLRARLGTRHAVASGKETNVHVVPDFTFTDTATGAVLLLADAKYKDRIGEADVYEALAFATATRCRDVMLLYPRMASDEEPGVVTIEERICIGGVQIAGAAVAVSGLAARGGFVRFAANVSEAVTRSIREGCSRPDPSATLP
jgi:hypothetical protein